MSEGDFYCHMCRQTVSKWHRIPKLKGIDPKSEFYDRICINCWPVYSKVNGVGAMA